MMNTAIFKFALPIGLTLLLAGLIAACGGGTTDSQTAPSPTQPAQATAAPGQDAADRSGEGSGSGSGSTATTAPASDEPFRIGVMDALTGVAESYGNPILQAKQLAVEEINAAGGVNGRMLEIIVEDSKCAAQDAITAYNKLTDVDGVKIILGTSCSGAMLGAAPLAEDEGVIMLSASATSPDIATAGDYIFRTAINDAQLGVDTGNTLDADGIHHLATITESTDYAEGARRTTVARFEELGGEVVAAESYPSEMTDFRSQLTKLIAADPDGIHLASQGEFSGGTIVKQLRELGYNGPIYTEVVPTGPEALGIAGEAATGMKAIIPNPELDTPAGIDFLANFEKRYGNVATIPWFQASGYDSVYIAAECLSQTGDDQDAAGFRDCLYNLTYSGAIGDNYGFDANGDVAGLGNVVVQVLPLAERNDDNLGYTVLGAAGSDAAVGGTVAVPPAAMQEPFVIGAMDALTGPAETYGNPILEAKLLAVEEINAAGGVNGRPLAIIPEDSKCAAQDAITAYNKLTDVDGVRIILGTTCSGAMLGAAPLAEAEGVIMLSASATSPDIATAGDYIFRTAINDNQLGIDTGNALFVDGHHHLATITESTDYAEGARRTTVARLEELGGHVVASESYTSDITDFRSQLTKLIASNPDAVYLAAQTEFSAGTIMKQLRELGYEGPIYSETVATGPESLQIAGEAATGMKAIIPNPELDTRAGMDFLANFEARYGRVATIPWFQASAYDDVYIAAECLGQTGDDQDADGFRDCLNGLTRDGAIGDNYSFDENGDLAGLSNVVVRILPLAERNDDNLGYVSLGQAQAPTP